MINQCAYLSKSVLSFGIIPHHLCSRFASFEPAICTMLRVIEETNCPITDCCYGTVWLMSHGNVNISVGHRNSPAATFRCDMENGCLHWIHSISNPLQIVAHLCILACEILFGGRYCCCPLCYKPVLQLAVNRPIIAFILTAHLCLLAVGEE